MSTITKNNNILDSNFEKELLNKLINKAIFSNKKSRIVFEEQGNFREFSTQIVDSTKNHIFFNNGENIPKRSVVKIEIL